MNLKEFKTNYDNIKKKYSLPSFQELNENFEIDKIDKESEILIKEIRKAMMEKIVGYVRFAEMLLNSSNAPPSFMIFVKDVRTEEKKALQEIYGKLVQLEIESLSLDISYSEPQEAAAIKEILKIWQEMKPNLQKIISMLKRNWTSVSEKKEKSYYG